MKSSIQSVAVEKMVRTMIDRCLGLRIKTGIISCGWARNILG